MLMSRVLTITWVPYIATWVTINRLDVGLTYHNMVTLYDELGDHQ